VNILKIFPIQSARVFLATPLLLAMSTSMIAQERPDAKTESSPATIISERAMAIHSRGYVFDGHNDLPWEIRKAPKRFDEWDIRKPQPQLHTDIDRLRREMSAHNFGPCMFQPKRGRQESRIRPRSNKSNSCMK
jgi:hypothetical protein